MGSLVAVWCSVLGGWKPYLIGGVALLIAGAVLALNSGAGPDWWTIVFLPLAIAIPTCFTLEFILSLIHISEPTRQAEIS